MLLCVEHRVTCNKVVDDCIGALIGVHSSGYVAHSGSWRGVLRHCQLLVRQATTLGRAHTHRPWENITQKHMNTISYVQMTTFMMYS